MSGSLATTDDLETALLRPLTSAEQDYAWNLIDQASALLRNAAPSLDDRIAMYEADSSNPRGLNPDVATVVTTTIVKRYLLNPRGLTNTSDTTGPYSHSESYVSRSDKETRGVLQVTASDLDTLFPNRSRVRVGSIRTRAGLAPRPVGHYGGFPTSGEALDAVIAWTPALSDESSVDPTLFTEGH